jgi:hypothetical protein
MGEDYKYLLRYFRFETFRDVWCATKLCIELDTVIFYDGLLVGAGKSHLAEDFEACVKALEYWYSRVLQDLQSGKSIEEVMTYTDTVLEQLKKAVRIGEIKRHWKATAIMQARKLLQAGRNEAIDQLHDALSKKPFIMRRPAEQ